MMTLNDLIKAMYLVQLGEQLYPAEGFEVRIDAEEMYFADISQGHAVVYSVDDDVILNDWDLDKEFEVPVHVFKVEKTMVKTNGLQFKYLCGKTVRLNNLVENSDLPKNLELQQEFERYVTENFRDEFCALSYETWIYGALADDRVQHPFKDAYLAKTVRVELAEVLPLSEENNI